MEKFGTYYGKVRLIVLKQQKRYGLQLWAQDDWEQEGMICLYQLLEANPGLQDDDAKLRVYFKTKFSNYVKDQLRAQSSIKRRIHLEKHEDIYELEYQLRDQRMSTEDYLIFQECLQAFRASLTTETDLDNLRQLLAGEVFKGRKALIKRLRAYFEVD